MGNNITDRLKYKESIVKFSRKYGVAKAAYKFGKCKRTIYRWRNRYDGTLESLKDKSRRPHSHPNQHTEEEIKLIKNYKRNNKETGLVDTATFLRSVLNKEVGLRTGKLMSHVSVFEVEGIDRLILLTDAAFNTYPDLKQKVQIINNSVMVAKACGIENPKVAPVCAVEVVNPDMPATIDAALLSKMSDRGQIKGCIVDGPLALDNALSEEAAHHKGVTGPVAGKADILVLPNIDVANVMYKSLTYTAQTKNGGILVGTSAPVILTSRADSFETKVNSIALAALVSEGRK